MTSPGAFSGLLPSSDAYAPRGQMLAIISVTLTIPVFVLSVTVWIMIQPQFMRLEYARGDFPADRYGWSHDQRLRLAQVPYAFLNQWRSPAEAIALLDGQEDPETQEPLYRERELTHMLDVKRLTDAARVIAAVLGASYVLLLWRARKSHARSARLALGVARGATVALLLVIVMGFLLTGFSFSSVFTAFHKTFFSAGSWTFAPSSTLIRLYPVVFWKHMALYAIGVYVTLSVILLFAARVYAGKHDKRRALGSV